MGVFKSAARFVPKFVKLELKQRIKEAVSPNANQILSPLYMPAIFREVVSFEPLAEGYQTAVVLRKG